MEEKLPALMSLEEMQRELQQDTHEVRDEDEGTITVLAWRVKELATTRRGLPHWTVTARRFDLTVKGTGRTRLHAWVEVIRLARTIRAGDAAEAG